MVPCLRSDVLSIFVLLKTFSEFIFLEVYVAPFYDLFTYKPRIKIDKAGFFLLWKSSIGIDLIILLLSIDNVTDAFSSWGLVD